MLAPKLLQRELVHGEEDVDRIEELGAAIRAVQLPALQHPHKGQAPAALGREEDLPRTGVHDVLLTCDDLPPQPPRAEGRRGRRGPRPGRRCRPTLARLSAVGGAGRPPPLYLLQPHPEYLLQLCESESLVLFGALLVGVQHDALGVLGGEARHHVA